MNTPVSFEIAKLLKEKGFDKECWNYYTLAYGKKPYITQGIEYQSDAKIKFDWNCNNEDSKRIQAPYPNTYHTSQCSAPTIAEAVMWLYEKYGIWIYADSHEFGKWCYNYKYNRPHVLNLKVTENGQFGLNDYNSPTEAYEAAIEYVLTKLI